VGKINSGFTPRKKGIHFFTSSRVLESNLNSVVTEKEGESPKEEKGKGRAILGKKKVKKGPSASRPRPSSSYRALWDERSFPLHKTGRRRNCAFAKWGEFQRDGGVLYRKGTRWDEGKLNRFSFRPLPKR